MKDKNTSTSRSITYNGDRIEYELTIKCVKHKNMCITKAGMIQRSVNVYVPNYKFSTEDTIYKAAIKVINNIAVADQIYGIIQSFGWQAKVSGSI